MRTMISYDKAVEILQTTPVCSLPSQKIIFTQAHNRYLAQDIFASKNVPPVPTSSMDGYAIASADIETLRNEGLCIQATNNAGIKQEFHLESKHTIRTYTGSRMPNGADTMILREDIDEWQSHGKEFIRLKNHNQVIKPKQWVRQVGENYTKGQKLLESGTRITPFEIGLLADLNQVFVQVVQKPKVGILTIGDEIIEVGEESESSNVLRSVNNHLLNALVESLGGEGILYPKVGDDRESIRALYRQALTQCDILLTTGGMSVGDFDFTKDIMAQETQIVFKGVRLKPGKPIAYGIYTNGSKQTHIFGLPGYPNSCAATFLLFGRIIFARLCGAKTQQLILEATLLDEAVRTDSRMEFRACDVQLREGKLYASFARKKTLQSSMIENLGAHTAFAILQENGESLPKGAVVPLLVFRDFL
ncbi:molybdopterin molybdotransferase MoeA [uncultured Helicobacter sp.]|uniref:molybdopterin molybdotransferase MoeA n=1 Tax=uncultured Helicobacter sp. TaxID=175537 RepID=UPI00374E2F2C